MADPSPAWTVGLILLGAVLTTGTQWLTNHWSTKRERKTLLQAKAETLCGRLLEHQAWTASRMGEP